MVRRNRYLGSFQIDGIPPGDAGDESVTVTFCLDIDGTLSATAVVESGGKRFNFTTTKTSCLFGTEEIRRTLAERERERAEDEREYDETERRIAIESLAIHLEELLARTPSEDPQFDRRFPPMMRNLFLGKVRARLPSRTGVVPSRKVVINVWQMIRQRLDPILSDSVPRWLQGCPFPD
jgi:hypothetical protein